MNVTRGARRDSSLRRMARRFSRRFSSRVDSRRLARPPLRRAKRRETDRPFSEVKFRTSGSLARELPTRRARGGCVARSLDAPHHADMPWHRTPQEAFAEAGVRVECDLDGDPAYEYSVCVVTERKRSGCFGSLFRGGRVARVARAPRAAASTDGPRDALEKETRHVRVVPVGRPRDAPFASIASAADVASLEAMRAELDSTSSALEEALDARERLRARRLQTARVGAGVAALQQRLDALDAVAAEAGEEDARARRDRVGRRGRRNIRRARRACRRPGDLLGLPRVEGLSESIARVLEPVRVFCESSQRDADEGETRAAKRACGGPGTRACLRTEMRRGERRRLIQKRESITHVRYERKRGGARRPHANVLSFGPSVSMNSSSAPPCRS